MHIYVGLCAHKYMVTRENIEHLLLCVCDVWVYMHTHVVTRVEAI